MRAAIYNPYLDTLGGGERYTLTFAKVLIEIGYKVDVEWKGIEIMQKLEERFGLELKGINVVDDIKRGDSYDICFWVSDGSIPALKARKNLIHFQIPFTNVNGRSLINKMKLFRINTVICNSEFTKKFIDKEYGVDSVVLYPPVPVSAMRPKRKENIILYVGRFSQLTQSKRQDILIRCFKKLYKNGLKDWQLILAGGVEVGADEFLEKLKNSINDYPISIVESPKFDELRDFYGKAKIFWSASGYGVNEDLNPKKVEHFGISVVEAMASGCIPIITNKGGHKEIIKTEVNGYLWNSRRQLIKITKAIIENPKILSKISKQAISDSVYFGNDRFRSKIENIL